MQHRHSDSLFLCLLPPFSFHQRYVIDGKTENDVTLDRLTTIPMPHRGASPQLRPRVEIETSVTDIVSDPEAHKLSSVEWLKKGLRTNKKDELVLRRCMIHQGWLNELLVQEHIIEPGEKAKKERCFQDYKAQLLYIEGMKAVLGEDYDPVTQQENLEKMESTSQQTSTKMKLTLKVPSTLLNP